MAELTLSSTNPWSTGGSFLGMKLGDPQSGLVLARRHGLLGATSPNDQICEEEVEAQLMKSSSVKMIRMLKEISQLNSELQELELEIHKQLLDKEMADFLHTDILESRLQKVNDLLNHLTEVVNGKDTIVGRLQSKAAESSLVVEAPYQKYAKSVLSSLGSSVTRLPSHCRQLEWIRNLDLNRTSLGDKLSSGTQSLVQCRATFQQCQALHNVCSQKQS